jgi:hypothetical protein
MKHCLLFFSLLFSLSFFAQPYKTSVGLRFANVGFTQLNGKHFLNELNAVELSLGGSSNYVWIQGNYEWQRNLTEEVDYYLGVGPGLGIVSGNPILGNSSSDHFMLGANGVVGAEYILPDFPFTFAFETGPYVQIIPSLRLGWNFGIAARYVLP